MCKDANECHYGKNGECALPVAGDGCFKPKAGATETAQPISSIKFEDWLRAECFQKPTQEAFDLAQSAWKYAIAIGT
jgi:hypothetical protein